MFDPHPPILANPPDIGGAILILPFQDKNVGVDLNGTKIRDEITPEAGTNDWLDSKLNAPAPTIHAFDELFLARLAPEEKTQRAGLGGISIHEKWTGGPASFHLSFTFVPT